MSKDVGHLSAIHSTNPFHEVIALSKDLLDPVLNAVVHCLDKMA